MPLLTAPCFLITTPAATGATTQQQLVVHVLATADLTVAPAVTAKCQAAGLSGSDLQNCEYDVQVSGDDKYVAIAANAKTIMVVSDHQNERTHKQTKNEMWLH